MQSYDFVPSADCLQITILKSLLAHYRSAYYDPRIGTRTTCTALQTGYTSEWGFHTTNCSLSFTQYNTQVLFVFVIYLCLIYCVAYKSHMTALSMLQQNKITVVCISPLWSSYFVWLIYYSFMQGPKIRGRIVLMAANATSQISHTGKGAHRRYCTFSSSHSLCTFHATSILNWEADISLMSSLSEAVAQ